jgi:hypothetical protein
MARAIDADRLKQAIDHDYYEHYTKYHDSDQTALIDMVMDDIDEMPTLTPPNEPLTCEGCAEDGKWEWEYQNGAECPCTYCKRRAADCYRRPPEVSP